MWLRGGGGGGGAEGLGGLGLGGLGAWGYQLRGLGAWGAVPLSVMHQVLAHTSDRSIYLAAVSSIERQRPPLCLRVAMVTTLVT